MQTMFTAMSSVQQKKNEQQLALLSCHRMPQDAISLLHLEGFNCELEQEKAAMEPQPNHDMLCEETATLAKAMGLTATLEYPPGVVYPSTEGSGLSVFRFTPMTDWMVLMAATPSQPAFNAVLAGKVMSVMLGVILAQTGMLALSLIQPHTSCRPKSEDYLINISLGWTVKRKDILQELETRMLMQPGKAPQHGKAWQKNEDENKFGSCHAA